MSATALVIVVAKNDRRINIEVAKTLEGPIPDVLAGRIINEQIKPAFQKNDYAGGLQRRDRPARQGASPARRCPRRRARAARASAASGFDLQDLAIFLFFGVMVGGAVLRSMLGRGLGSVADRRARRRHRLVGHRQRADRRRRRADRVDRRAASAGSGSGGGRAARQQRADHLGRRWRRRVRGGGFGGGGGGFSSGGGGDFGGGGASGSW